MGDVVMDCDALGSARPSCLAARCDFCGHEIVMQQVNVLRGFPALVYSKTQKPRRDYAGSPLPYSGDKSLHYRDVDDVR